MLNKLHLANACFRAIIQTQFYEQLMVQVLIEAYLAPLKLLIASVETMEADS